MSTSAAPLGFMCKLKDRVEVAKDTLAFRIEKPAGWTFQAGQYLDMTLLDPPRDGFRRKCAKFFDRQRSSRSNLILATRMFTRK